MSEVEPTETAPGRLVVVRKTTDQKQIGWVTIEFPDEQAAIQVVEGFWNAVDPKYGLRMIRSGGDSLLEHTDRMRGFRTTLDVCIMSGLTRARHGGPHTVYLFGHPDEKVRGLPEAGVQFLKEQGFNLDG